MRKTVLAIAMALVIVLSFSACGLPSAQEINDGVLQTQGDITSYQYDGKIVMVIVSESDGEGMEGTITLDNTGAVDFDNMKMAMNMNMNAVLSEEDDYDVEVMEMYIIDDMIYMQIPEMAIGWIKTGMSTGDWEELAGLIDMASAWEELIEGVPVQVTGSEKVNGVDCFVLEYTPDPEQLWDIVLEQFEASGEDILGLGMLTAIFPEPAFSEVSFRQLVAKDTYFVIKYEIAMTVEFADEIMGEEVSIIMEIDIRDEAYDYNQPVSIVLPPGAEQAIEL